MSPEQNKHLELIKNDFSAELKHKYERGQAEHGGNLWERPALQEAKQEVVDLVTYLYTLEEQILSAWDLARSVTYAIETGNYARAKDLSVKLEQLLHSQLRK